ncbi:MAG: hypothetical protein WCG47_28115 [Dermatophilaceae bacterium]
MAITRPPQWRWLAVITAALALTGGTLVGHDGDTPATAAPSPSTPRLSGPSWSSPSAEPTPTP